MKKRRLLPLVMLLFVLPFATLLPSCTLIRKAPQNKPYLVKNTIELKGDLFTAAERTGVISRLRDQLDDSSKIITREALFIFRTIVRPPVYDSSYAGISARNMRASLFHLGYYNASVDFIADTNKRKVHVTYNVNAGPPTLIDSFNYRLGIPELQAIAESGKEKSLIKKGEPITKSAVLGEINRLVDTFRNNGYYRFTAAELRMRGDTLPDVSNVSVALHPDSLRAPSDSPRIDLTLVINSPVDSSHLQKYFINRITIYPDLYSGESPTDPRLQSLFWRGITIRRRENLFKNNFLLRQVTFKPGDVYRHNLFNKMVNNFSRTGVWESVNVRMNTDSLQPQQVNMDIELLPARKLGFEAALEASYSANSNTNNALAGNLFGLSGNLSLTNRNMGKEGIRMTHRFRAGIELNNNHRANNVRLVNAQEFSYSNMVVFPRLIMPVKKWRDKDYPFKETFLNNHAAVSKRLDLFNTQTFVSNFGWNFTNRKNWRWTIKPLNFEFNYLYNQTDSFTRILDSIPFLRYSYNTALITGMSAGVSHVYFNPKHPRSLSRERGITVNLEESGLTWGSFIRSRYRRSYIRADVEYKYTVNYEKTALAFRLFAGVGVPFRNDNSLPFFKQYFSGGSNGMRAWPIRGIGRGSQPLVPFGRNIFNDRTGDMQLEGNAEYRYVIARIIPQTLTLRGAVFVDAGNIWNLRNSRTDGLTDSAQFKFKNLYRELGVAAGTGFRLDFNYFILRLDMGFRFKRPELSGENDGWHLPKLGFDDLIPKLFGRKYRQWRYENFNFTIGISYPF